MRIGIDLMGGDSSPVLIFDALIQALEKLNPSLRLVAIATKALISELESIAKLKLHADNLPRLTFSVAADYIGMHEEPLTALRQKKGSSTATGMRLLKKKQIDAFISTGNTGALVASATLSLPKLSGITRPALLAVLPTKNGSVAVVDVGGTVSSKAHHLLNYAYMGAAFQKCTAGIEIPRVGLLNIGSESKKGTSVVREAYQLLSNACQPQPDSTEQPYMHFYGNIEGREVFHGKVDVLVTDGFTGNVLVKTSEGIADVIFEHLIEDYHRKPSDELQKRLHSIQSLFHYAEYQGALLCGIDGIVIKCHGHSNAKAIFNGIKGAIAMIQNKLLDQIKAHL